MGLFSRITRSRGGVCARCSEGCGRRRFDLGGGLISHRSRLVTGPGRNAGSTLERLCAYQHNILGAAIMWSVRLTTRLVQEEQNDQKRCNQHFPDSTLQPSGWARSSMRLPRTTDVRRLGRGWSRVGSRLRSSLPESLVRSLSSNHGSQAVHLEGETLHEGNELRIGVHSRRGRLGSRINRLAPLMRRAFAKR
jgi:hypothetical protein